MAVSTASKRLALDTNVLLDRANGEFFAKDFCEIFQGRNYSLEIPQTVIAELAYFQRRGSATEQRAAEIALLSMIDWGLTPIVLRDVEKSYKQNFYRDSQRGATSASKRDKRSPHFGGNGDSEHSCSGHFRSGLIKH